MFKKLLFLSIFLFLTIGNTFAQWDYVRKISFPEADSNTVRPYLSTLDENERLWVISTKAANLDAHNAIWYADRGDTIFTKFIDFDHNGDSDTLSGNIGATRGIAALNGSIYLSFTVPYPKYKPHTLSGMYRYENADTNNVFKLVASPSPTYGYGSYNHGIDITKDSIVFAGITFGTSFRMYNYSQNETMTMVSEYGHWIPGNIDNPGENGYSNLMEPGGPQTAGIDLIRDLALVDGADYHDPSSVFYTSRNSYSVDQRTGGISAWYGGTVLSGLEYTPARVVDFNDYLSFIDVQLAYGIDVDANGILWVAGTDSTRQWVKGFALDGINAVAVYDLPSSTSMDIADPNGAPFNYVTDVSINHNAGVAYVVDMFGECAYVFQNQLVSVTDKKQLPISFELAQNYPNPFNPTTNIKFTLPHQGHIKLFVTDVLGREVKTIVNEVRSKGTHDVKFNAADLATGVYMYHLISGDFSQSKKMLLVK